MNIRRNLIRAVNKYPIYRAMPSGQTRTQAQIAYLTRHRQYDVLAELIRTGGRIPTRYATTALGAVKAAFHVGDDDLVQDTLAVLIRRFPEHEGVWRMRARFQAFYGDHQSAYMDTHHARCLRPSSPESTAQLVRLAYDTQSHDDADRIAVEAVGHLPKQAVLWAACHECSTPEQYDRIWQTWSNRVSDEAKLVTAVRPLAAAAQRAGLPEIATQLYIHAISLMKDGAPPTPVRSATLAGNGAWWAIHDLCDALQDQQFFFAAGTALGLVREAGPLTHDDDIDVGLFEGDWDAVKLRDIFARHPRFELIRHPLTKKIGLRHRAGSRIDVFPFYSNGGKYWHDGVFVRWHNTPFTVRRIRVKDMMLPIPHDSHVYLTDNYGDWRTPHPTFDAFTTDAPNMEVTWPQCHRLHMVRRAYRLFSAGDSAGGDLALGLASVHADELKSSQVRT